MPLGFDIDGSNSNRENLKIATAEGEKSEI